MNSGLHKIISQLKELGFSEDEAIIYIELLRNPCTHMQLSQATDINRTKIYRIALALEQKGLISKRSDEHGTFLAANDLANIELQIVEQEDKLKKQRVTIHELITELAAFQSYNPGEFFINTYEGTAGFRQMCWNELKTNNTLLVLGNGTVEEQVGSKEWASRHRIRQQQAGYMTLEITNYPYETKETNFFTDRAIFATGLYEHRMIDPKVITFDGQTVVYNNTVAIYHWKHKRKVGIEITSASYATMMRQVFNQYWNMATRVTARTVAKIHG